MELPIQIIPPINHPDFDLNRALITAQQALTAETADEAKFFHGLARFYWARCNFIA